MGSLMHCRPSGKLMVDYRPSVLLVFLPYQCYNDGISVVKLKCTGFGLCKNGAGNLMVSNIFRHRLNLGPCDWNIQKYSPPLPNPV